MVSSWKLLKTLAKNHPETPRIFFPYFFSKNLIYLGWPWSRGLWLCLSTKGFCISVSRSSKCEQIRYWSIRKNKGWWFWLHTYCLTYFKKRMIGVRYLRIEMMYVKMPPLKVAISSKTFGGLGRVWVEILQNYQSWEMSKSRLGVCRRDLSPIFCEPIVSETRWKLSLTLKRLWSPRLLKSDSFLSCFMRSLEILIGRVFFLNSRGFASAIL